MVCLRDGLKNYIVILCSFVMFWMNLGCDTDKSGTGSDKPSLGTVLQQKAYAYISGGDPWYIAPGGGSDGYTQNTSGAVAWSGNGWLNGSHSHETLETFKTKIRNSSVPMQTSWADYVCAGGTPPYGCPICTIKSCPDAGMVCYVLVAQAMADAGYGIDVGGVVDCNFFSGYTTVTGVVKVGDIVLYDWDWQSEPTLTYDHSGIVVGNTDFADPKYYTVISCVNLLRYFNEGAIQHRLGIFDDIPASEGGPGDNYKIKIVRP